VIEGTLCPGAPFQIVEEGRCYAVVDGNNGMGRVIATKSMQIAVEKALAEGLGCVVARNGNDLGMLANYTMQAVSRDCIGIAMTHGVPKVAPWGGREPVFSTNPISIGVPAGEKYPIVLDMATSAISAGKIWHAAQEGAAIPEGWAVDSSGSITTDPKKAIEGTILPLGGYKGFGLAVMVDVLSGLLAGFSMTRAEKNERPWNIGQFFLAIHVEKFGKTDAFKKRIDEFIADIKTCPLMPGFSEITMPGERGYRATEDSAAKGVEIPDFHWNEMKELAEELDIEL
jgi:ureidoglycolate dehydrogenase (NAD+)